MFGQRRERLNPEVEVMEPLKDLPMGFGMALLQDPAAQAYFISLPRAQQQAILNQTHAIQSRREMKAFVHGLPEHANG